MEQKSMIVVDTSAGERYVTGPTEALRHNAHLVETYVREQVGDSPVYPPWLIRELHIEEGK